MEWWIIGLLESEQEGPPAVDSIHYSSNPSLHFFLPRSVTAAYRALTPTVLVRIQARQPFRSINNQLSTIEYFRSALPASLPIVSQTPGHEMANKPSDAIAQTI